MSVKSLDCTLKTNIILYTYISYTSIKKEIAYLHSFKVSLHKIVINFKGKNSSVTMEKPKKHHYNHMIKVNTITSKSS